MGKTFTGWEEIRQTLVFVDRLSEVVCNGARIEVYEHIQESSVKVSFRSLQELDEWLKMSFRKQLLKGGTGSVSQKLDVLSEAYGHVVVS